MSFGSDIAKNVMIFGADNFLVLGEEHTNGSNGEPENSFLLGLIEQKK